MGDEVEAAINQITEKEIGVHVNFNWVNGADYATQLSLANAQKFGLVLPTTCKEPEAVMKWIK